MSGNLNCYAFPNCVQCHKITVMGSFLTTESGEDIRVMVAYCPVVGQAIMSNTCLTGKWAEKRSMTKADFVGLVWGMPDDK